MELLGEASAAVEYFAAIEEQFGRLRGRPLLLSPRDVALVKDWHDAGVPLRVVVKALDRFFAREARRDKPRRRPPTIEYCERDVYELWEEWKAAHLGDGETEAEPGASPGAILAAHLEAARTALAAAQAGAEARGARSVARAIAKVLEAAPARLALAHAGAVGELEQDLAEAESRVLRAARRDLGAAALERLAAETRERVEPHRGRIDDKAYEVLCAKTEDRALLAHFAIPRIALFSF